MIEQMSFRSMPLWLLLLGLSLDTALADTAGLMTFGLDADPAKGDDDFQEDVVIRVPKTISQPLYLRIFDPDVGGAEDEPSGPWNTRTRFALFGGDVSPGAPDPGAGAAPASSSAGAAPGRPPLAEAVFGADPMTDGEWYTLGSFTPEQGEAVDGSYVFTFLAEGLAGDDGNLYDVAVSTDPRINTPPPGVVLSSRGPTISIPPGRHRYAEVRFTVPSGTTGLTIRNFDLDHAPAELERPFDQPVPLRSSADARWLEDHIALEPSLEPQAAGVLIRGGRTLSNNVVLQASDQDGTPLSFELPVQLVPHGTPAVPVAEFETLSDCHSVAFDASRSRAGEGQLSSYQWDFGDGQSGAGQRTTHRYADPGTYQVLLTVIDDSGRVIDRARRAYPVKVNRPPEPVPGSKQVVAPGERLRFDAGVSTDADGRIVGFQWDFGDGQRGDGRAVSHVFAQPGRYAVALRVEDDGPGPCDDATVATEVWINAPPTAEAGLDQAVAAGDSVRLDGGGSRDSDGSLTTFVWDLGDGQVAQGKTAQHAYASPGRYRVTLKVQDDAGASNSEAVDGMTVWVNDPPVAQAGGDRRGAVAQALSFDASGSRDLDGRLIEYSWDFSDGQQATGREVSHAFDGPGRYVVTLTVRDDSGTGSDTATAEWPVDINDPPIADAGPDQTVTASEVQFDAGGSRDPDGEILKWQWDFGDGAMGRGPAPSHVYAAPGRYPVVLTVTDDSGTTSASSRDAKTVIVNAKPVADAGPDRLAIPGQSVDFDASGSFDPDGRIIDYRWQFGDGSAATGAVVSHAYARPGRYQVGLQVQDDTGHPDAVGFADAVITVNAPPVALAGRDIEAAPGQLIELDAGVSYDPDGMIASYRWSFSDGQDAAEGPRISRSFQQPGSVTATLEVADDSGAANGLAQDQVTITINHRPVAVPGAPVRRCGQWVALDGSASSDADGDRLRCTWDFGDDSPPGQGERVLHGFPESGRYPVVLAVDDATGLANATHSASTEVWIHSPPVAVASAPALTCAGEMVLFNGTKSYDHDGGPLLYSWDFGDGTRAQQAAPAKAFSHGGIYTVRLQVQDDSGLSCNTGEDRVALTVVEAPVADAGRDQTVCAQTPVRFDGSASRDSDGVVNGYSWDFGDGSTGGGANPTHLFTAPGTYPVTLTVTGDRVGHCDNRNSDQVLITVLDAPRIQLDAPGEAAVGQPVAFKAMPLEGSGGSPAGVLAYRWEFGDGSSAEGSNVEHRYTEAGGYQAVAVADAGGSGECSRVRLEHAIRVNAPPRAVAGDDRVVAPGDIVVVDGSASSDPDGAISRYRWDFGDGVQTDGVRVSHSYRLPGSYVAQLRVTDNTGLDNNEDRDEVTIRNNASPLPSFDVDPAVPCSGQEVILDASLSTDPDGTLQQWQWTFGDGGRGEGERVIHSYDEPGRYALTLSVTDDSRVANSTAMLVREIIINQTPQAEIDAPPMGCPAEGMQFSAARTVDPDGQIRTYRWSFGDGNEGEGREVSHAYARPGRYPVTLTVTDDSTSVCDSAQRDTEVIVNGAPRAVIRVSSTVAFVGGAHDAILFDATESTDPDGDPLNYRWDFGDNTEGRGPELEHTFTKVGRYTVTLEVKDDTATACASGIEQVEIEVRNRDLR